MGVQKSFVNPDGTATITCPKCGVIKNIHIGHFREKQHTLKVRCSCTHAWDHLFDFRRHYRKKTKLPGTYSLEPPASGGGPLIVLNISRSGVGFSVIGTHALKVGQKARIQFNLDDKKKTPLNKEVVIKIVLVKDGYIGCEFVDDHAFEKDLGFYLQP